VTREVRLTSAERVLYPESGVTKGDLFDYYGRVAPVLVPHLRDRPFTMKRWPHGIHGEAFFQKQAPKGMPEWIPTRQFRTQPRQGEARMVDFPLLNSREAVLFMVQQNCIDMNAWYSRVDKPTRPDFVLFDLDPPDGEFRLGVKAAHLVREALEGLELRSYVKTSGSEGIHILVPVTRRYGFPEAHRFAELVSKQLAAENPGVITTEWLKRKRVGVLIDYHQNGAGKTIASAYSVRPKEGAPVSTPLRWEELTPRLDPGRFTMEAMLRRVEKEGDLFEPVLRGGQSLGTALRRLERHSASQAAPRRPSQRGVRRT
jgi:bifunctional non-homologous end joining protein LigD